jgi:hypothetical protein
MDCATMGLHLLAEVAGGAVIKALQNMSLALTRLDHHELALGYAHVATRLQPDAAKAHFWAATAAHKLHAYEAARFYLGQARFVLTCAQCWRSAEATLEHADLGSLLELTLVSVSL